MPHPRDIWKCLEIFLIVTAEGRGATKHPTVHRTVPTTENDRTPNVISAEGERTARFCGAFRDVPQSAPSERLNC